MKHGNRGKFLSWLSRRVLFVAAVCLIMASCLGALQSLLLPGALCWEVNASTHTAEIAVGSTRRDLQLVTMLGIQWKTGLPVPSTPKSHIRFVRKGGSLGIAVLPTIDVWRPDNRRRFLLDVRVPYVTMLLLGLSIEWIRRKMVASHGGGFPITAPDNGQDHQREKG